MLQVSLRRVLGMMAFVTNFTKLCDIPWHVTVVTLWRLTIHPVLRRILGMMMFFFDKLTVICDTTWHVTVVTVCRVTMQGAMGGGRGLTPAATKSRAFHTEQLEQAPQPTPFYRSPSLHCGDHQPQCACESPLGVNWVIEIGAWGGCVPLLETAERSAGRRRWRRDLVVPALVVSVREVGKGRA